jgi:hypothetical protein
MEAGKKLRDMYGSANEAASKKFNLSSSQIRRALNDTDYLIDARWLRDRIYELNRLVAYRKLAPLQHERINRYENYFAEKIQAGKSEAYASNYAVCNTAKDSGITEGQVRRILDTFGIRRRRYK